MKRTALKRRSPLQAKAKPVRRKPLRKVNRKRAAKRKAEAFGPQAALCRTLPCCMCDATMMLQGFRTVPHHEPPRSVGGLDGDCLPLCGWHHIQRHQVGASAFWGQYNWQAFRDGLRARVAREAA